MASSPLQAAAHAHGDHGHHVQPLSFYFKTGAVLTVGMILTIAAYKYNWGGTYIIANVIALTIAFVKAGFVVWNFMHVKFASTLGKMFAFLGFLWLPVLMVILVDYGFRNHEQSPSFQLNGEETAFPRQLKSKDHQPNSPNSVNTQNRTPYGRAF